MGKPAARLGDTTSHGSPLLGAPCPTVLIGGKPAWRIGDQHTCPIPNAPPPACSGTPHGPGVTTPVPDGGTGTCLIGGKPAARVGDIVMEPGALIPLPPPNNIAVGEFTVLIGMAGGGGASDVCTTEGHPVDVVTGRMIEWVSDYERLSPAPLLFKRYYDSHLEIPGVFGRGWRHCYEYSLKDIGTSLELTIDVGATLRLPKPPIGETVSQGDIRIESRGQCEFVVWLKPDKGLHFKPHGRDKLVLATMYDPNGLTHRLVHDDASRLLQVYDHCGHSLEFQYSGEQIAAIFLRSCENHDHSRIVVRYTYHADGSLAEAFDAIGSPLTYRYSGGYLVQETNRSGFSFYFDYDRKGRCICTWGDGGILYRRLDYDPEHGLTRVINSRGVSRIYEHVNGLVTRLLHADGASKVWAYNEKCLLICEMDETGVGFCYAYDDNNRLSKIVTPGGGSIQYSYDEIGRVIQYTTSEGYTETWSYDSAGRILAVDQSDDRSEHRYDTSGNLIQVLRAGHATEYAYDGHNRLVRISSGEGHWICLAYDEFSNVVRLSDSLGTLTTRSFDVLDRVIAAIDPDGGRTTYGWNTDGLLDFVCERDGTERRMAYQWQLLTEERIRDSGSGKDAITRYEYNTETNLTAILLPGSGRIDYIWNDRQQVVERRETNGDIVRFHHDAAGRVTEEMNSAFSVRFEHDEAGNLVAVHGPDGSSIEYGYDGFGRLVLGVCGDYVSQLEYDNLGRLVKESCGGRFIEYSYGSAQQRIGVKPSNGVPVNIDIASTGGITGLKAAGETVAQYRRDARGRLISVQFGNGLQECRGLDLMGQMRTQDVVTVGGQLLVHKEFEYDTAQRLVERRTNGVHSRFAYTGTGWVRSESSTGHADPRPIAYDDHGNPGRIHGRIALYGEGDRLLSDGLYSYEYDSIGRLVARITKSGDRCSFHYDFRDLLIRVDHPDGNSTQYQYDAFGRRVLKDDNGCRTAYLWDGHQLLSTWDVASPSIITQYVMDPFRWAPVAQLKLSFGGTTPQIESFYCHTDHIGAVTELTSAEGMVVWSTEYDAFGAATLVNGNADVTILRRPGQYFDSETGFYYNRYRYYDPSIGRFTTPDPTHISGGLNLYRYPGSTLTTLDLLGLSGLIGMVDNNFLASLESAVKTGDDAGLVRFAQKNKGRLGVSPTAHNEFTNPQGSFGPSELKARRALLRRFGIEMQVLCSGSATAEYERALARYRANGLGENSQLNDARVAAHARASNLPLISSDKRAFVTNQQFVRNNVSSLEVVSSGRGADVFRIGLL